MALRRGATARPAKGAGEVSFRVLGPLAVLVGGVEVTPTANRERSLLARLLLSPNRVVPVGQLVDDLWDDDPPESAQGSLQVAVHRLRKRLGDPARITTQAQGYVLAVADGELDRQRFEDLVANGDAALAAGDPTTAASVLAEALALWTGEALGDLASRRFAQPEAVRLDQARLSAVEARVGADLELGRHAGLLGELEALTSIHPLHEGLWRSWATALYRSGRQADALRALQRLREALLDDLGIDPSPATCALELAVLEHRVPEVVRSSPDPTGPEALPHPVAPGPADGSGGSGGLPPSAPPRGLPRQATPLIGRDREVGHVLAALAEPGLATITGMAGVGKTRVARAVAPLVESVATVAFVDLVDVGPADGGVLAAVAEGLGLEPRAALADVAAVCSSAPSLVLLDNCDGAVEATAALVDALLDRAPGLRVLATSRERLRVAGEQPVRLFPLHAAGVEQGFEAVAASPAVALFVDRARRAQPAFELTPDNAEAVVTVCRQLEGLPLAIGLAAARLRSVGLVELVERLEDRFGVLTGGDRSTAVHHRTLRSLLEATVGQLDPLELRLLGRLSVFDAGWTLAAAEAVAADDELPGAAVLDALSGLAERSVVDLDPSSGRYSMLTVVRAFAGERLDDDPGAAGVRTRHRRWAKHGR